MKSTLFVILFIFIFTSLKSQDQIGNVYMIKISDGNNPISDVNVLVNGTLIGATSQNGEFSFRQKKETKLSLSLAHAAYNRLDTVVDGNRALISLLMFKKQVNLEEVEVSTGYQSVPKYQTTGSFETVRRDLLERQIGTSILPMLDGLTSGLSFDRRKGGMSGMQIRGLSSLSTDLKGPLIIVDNFPFEGDITSLNPQDIENVTLLKDAAASAIWGARAGNGVVVITTKKGRNNQKVQVGLTSNLTLIERPDLFYSPQIRSADYIENEKFLFDRGVFNNVLNNTTTRPMISPVVELLDAAKKGKISESRALMEIERLKGYDIRDDYRKYLYRTGVNQQYYLNLNGGSTHFNYLVSAGLDGNLSSLRENGLDRMTLRAVNSLKINERLDMQLDFNLSQRKTTTHNPGELTGVYPYARLADDQDNPLAVDRAYRYKYIDTVGGGRLMDWRFFPLKEIKEQDNWSRDTYLRLNIGFKYKIVDAINLDVKYQYERGFGKDNNMQSEELFFTRNLINRYTSLSGGNVVNHIPKGGILDIGNRDMSGHNVRGQLNVDYSWGADHQLTAIAGAELRRNLLNESFQRSYGVDKRLKTSSPVDYVTRFSIFDRLGGTLSIPYVDRFSTADNRMVSFFTNAAYSFRQRYTLSVSARRDASNLFGVRTNDRWKPLWSTGVKWSMHNESFFNVAAIDLLVLRGSYGHSGNVDNSVPAVATLNYNSTLSPLARLPYGFLQHAPNPDLRWEDVGQLNVGVDAGLMKGVIRLTLDYYRKNATDLITDEDTDPTLGMASLKKNSGNLLTQGIDFTAAAKLIDRNFKWDISLNASWNRNKLTKINRKVFSLRAAEFFIPPTVDYPLNSLFSYKFEGLNPETGAPLGLLNGEPSEDYVSLTNSTKIELQDLVYEGSVVPTYFGNMMHTFALGNLSFSFNIGGKFGYKYRRNTILYAQLTGTNFVNIHGDYYRRWQHKGDEKYTTVPAMVYPANTSRDNFYSLSEATVEHADHIRVQDISLSYAPGISRKWMKGLNLRFYCNNANIILWKKSKAGLDPLYGNNMPLSRSYGVGFNLKF